MQLKNSTTEWRIGRLEFLVETETSELTNSKKNTSCPLISFHLYTLAKIANDSRQQQRPTTAGLQKGLPAKQDTTPTVVL